MYDTKKIINRHSAANEYCQFKNFHKWNIFFKMLYLNENMILTLEQKFKQK